MAIDREKLLDWINANMPNQIEAQGSESLSGAKMALDQLTEVVRTGALDVDDSETRTVKVPVQNANEEKEQPEPPQA